MIEPGSPGPDFTLDNQDGESVTSPTTRPLGRIVLLSQGGHPRLHDTGVRRARPPRRVRQRLMPSCSASRRPRRRAEEVRGQARTGIHAAGRSRPRRGGGARRVGAEVDVRADLLGQPAGDVHHRWRRNGPPRDPEGHAEDARR